MSQADNRVVLYPKKSTFFISKAGGLFIPPALVTMPTPDGKPISYKVSAQK